MTVNIHIQPLHEIITLEKGKPPAQSNYNGNREECYLSPDYLRGKAEAELIKPATNAVRVLDGETIVLWDGSNAGEIFRARNGILASTMMRVRHNTDYESEYFYYALKSWEGYLKGQTSGSGVPHVDKEILGNLKLFNCEKTEQSKIAEILSTVDRAIEQTEGLIAKQQRIKTGLMQDILTRGIDEHGNLRSEETHEFKDSPLGRIPVEWEVFILNDCVPTVAPICYGILMPGQGHDGGVPVIKVKDVIGGRIIQNNILLTDPKIDAQYRRSRLRDGDLLLTIRGTTGRVAIVPPELNGANITQDTARIRLKDGFSNFFFYFLMQSVQLQDQIKLHTLGQAVKGINIGEVKRLSFGLPDKTEQFEISKRLIAIQQLLDSSEERFRKLCSLKTALMQDLLTGKVRVTPLLEKMEACP
jgi:type I restriction enzyme S subunit